MSSVSLLLRVVCTLVMTHHDWFQGGSPLPTALVLISPLGVCRILPRPMPLSFGSFCVLRVTWAPDVLFQKKQNNNNKKQNVCLSAWLLISCLPLFVSPGHPVTSSWAPCSRLFLVCSSIARALFRVSRLRSPVSLPCFVFVVLVRALSFCSGSARPFGVQFIFQFCALPLLGTALQLFSGFAPIFLTQVDRLLFQGFF